jgi:hypothetical protein
LIKLISHSWYVPPKIAVLNPGLHVEALVLEAVLEVASASATFAVQSRSRRSWASVLGPELRRPDPHQARSEHRRRG